MESKATGKQFSSNGDMQHMKPKQVLNFTFVQEKDKERVKLYCAYYINRPSQFEYMGKEYFVNLCTLPLDLDTMLGLGRSTEHVLS